MGTGRTGVRRTRLLACFLNVSSQGVHKASQRSVRPELYCNVLDVSRYPHRAGAALAILRCGCHGCCCCCCCRCHLSPAITVAAAAPVSLLLQAAFDRHMTTSSTRMYTPLSDPERAFFKLWSAFARRRPLYADFITRKRCAAA